MASEGSILRLAWNESHHRSPQCSSEAVSSAPHPRAFTTLCYSADGQSVLAGGMSKFVCLYHVREQILMKRFELSCNLSLDAMEVSSRAGWLAGVKYPVSAWARATATLGAGGWELRAGLHQGLDTLGRVWDRECLSPDGAKRHTQPLFHLCWCWPRGFALFSESRAYEQAFGAESSHSAQERAHLPVCPELPTPVLSGAKCMPLAISPGTAALGC